ncbi:Carboxy-terminal processing protease CtpB precursor [uncultured Clostridium sp.]|uniref:S41 family peptidase n=1 Tax=Muricoprocola aceti TaxID=2981772 RepID=A0ABT2SMH0_9FIRM|nr:S41 family peptidase [Muricoprocola aceti]MCU6725709.1 S41 family peptidase [Muricoprocola aceti]SCH61195.1 Carboxy-terminal processing protease CtpB precursor [uncultured Clostridium sp.]
MEQKNENEKFLKGLFCGVFLVLICMAGCLLHLQWKMTRRAAVSTGSEKTETLDMNLSQVKKKTGEIEELINAYYLDEIDGQKVEDTMYTGMVAGLEDPYSVYYSKEELESMEESISGAYSGIGATLTQDPDTGELSVVSCFDGTPAQEAGLQPGDVITGWNGKSVEGIELSELVSKIKTDPEEQLTLEIERDGETLEVELTRREVQIPTVEYEMLDNQIGYIRLVEFDEVTADQFKEALEDLENQNMEKLIIDVRNNPGGVLQVVCDMLDQLLPEGLIVYTEDKNGNRKEYTSDEEHQFTKPLAVLANENSASASEIFAGAIQDYGIGTIVGTTTFGKGIVQRTFYLSDGTGVKLTVAKYYTPKGHDIHKKGITPDVEIELDEELKNQSSISHEEDNQLQKAIEVLQEEK